MKSTPKCLHAHIKLLLKDDCEVRKENPYQLLSNTTWWKIRNNFMHAAPSFIGIDTFLEKRKANPKHMRRTKSNVSMHIDAQIRRYLKIMVESVCYLEWLKWLKLVEIFIRPLAMIAFAWSIKRIFTKRAKISFQSSLNTAEGNGGNTEIS